MNGERPEVVNESSLDWEERSHGSEFEIRRKRLGATAGGERLGCSLYELPPGKILALPLPHCERGAIYVLDGDGTL